MTGYVTDTHALLWHLLKSERISKGASSVFEDADDGKLQIFVPSIVLVEIVYLTEKARISKEAINRVIDYWKFLTTTS